MFRTKGLIHVTFILYKVSAVKFCQEFIIYSTTNLPQYLYPIHVLHFVDSSSEKNCQTFVKMDLIPNIGNKKKHRVVDLLRRREIQVRFSN